MWMDGLIQTGGFFFCPTPQTGEDVVVVTMPHAGIAELLHP